MLALCCAIMTYVSLSWPYPPLMLAYVGPMLRQHDPPWPYMFAHVDPTWAEIGPMLALGPP